MPLVFYVNATPTIGRELINPRSSHKLYHLSQPGTPKFVVLKLNQPLENLTEVADIFSEKSHEILHQISQALLEYTDLITLNLSIPNTMIQPKAPIPGPQFIVSFIYINSIVAISI